MQTQFMGYMPRYLDRKTKARRHRMRPSLIGLRAMGTVKRAVDFNRIQARGITLQMGALPGKSGPLLTRQAPTGTPQKKRHQNNTDAASLMKISTVFGPTPSNAVKRFSNSPRSALALWMRLILPAYSAFNWLLRS